MTWRRGRSARGARASKPMRPRTFIAGPRIDDLSAPRGLDGPALGRFALQIACRATDEPRRVRHLHRDPAGSPLAAWRCGDRRHPVLPQVGLGERAPDGARQPAALSAGLKSRPAPCRNGVFQAKSAPRTAQGPHLRHDVPIRRTNLRTLSARRVPEPLQGCRIFCRLNGRCSCYFAARFCGLSFAFG